MNWESNTFWDSYPVLQHHQLNNSYLTIDTEHHPGDILNFMCIGVMWRKCYIFIKALPSFLWVHNRVISQFQLLIGLAYYSLPYTILHPLCLLPDGVKISSRKMGSHMLRVAELKMEGSWAPDSSSGGQPAKQEHLFLDIMKMRNSISFYMSHSFFPLSLNQFPVLYLV